jgi:hypothetical protein
MFGSAASGVWSNAESLGHGVGYGAGDVESGGIVNKNNIINPATELGEPYPCDTVIDCLEAQIASTFNSFISHASQCSIYGRISNNRR